LSRCVFPATLAEAVRVRAAAEKIPMSTYVCRVLTRAVEEPDEPVLSESRVEEIVRQVLRESA